MIIKHTPAPWTVRNTFGVLEITKANKFPIAEISWLNEDFTDDDDVVSEAEADAKLITAAPDLLDALIDIEGMVNKSVSGIEKYSVIEWQILLSKTQSAIAKATQ